MMHSKVRELRKPVKPFSTTDTEPEMRECNMSNVDKKRAKAKWANYSTSETEEEYQAYLRSRSKWHGKGGHKDSWDPMQIESPPQITQKPVGIIPKPTPQAPTAQSAAVERGAQVGQTPIFVPPFQQHEPQVPPPTQTKPQIATKPQMPKRQTEHCLIPRPLKFTTT